MTSLGVTASVLTLAVLSAPAWGKKPANPGLDWPAPASLGSELLEPFAPASPLSVQRVREQASPVRPAAVALRNKSRTEFEHLSSTSAAQLARQAFPMTIGHPAGGPPPLPSGGRLVGFLSPKAAQLALPGGKRAVIESLRPMAIETSPGHRAPVDLGLTKTAGVYESVRPLVGVLIPQRLSVGVELPTPGVTLTPTNAQGQALGGANGQVDGASVLYANTQTDTDTAVKPTLDGVETDTILRSVDSPEQQYFRLGVAAGTRLVQVPGGDGPVQVLSGGRKVALIRPPSAVDAAGTSVPVTMSLKGDLLTLSVSAQGGAYQWPIAVDPEIVTAEDHSIGPRECRKSESEGPTSNWCWFASPESNFTHEWNTNLNGRAVGIKIESVGGSLSAGNYAGVGYHTQGESKIVKLEAETVGLNFKRSEARLELAEKRGTEAGSAEASATIERAGANSAGWEFRWTTVSSAGHPENVAAVKVEALETNIETHIGLAVNQVIVTIQQEKSPEVTFNESESTIDSGRSNVLYKSSGGSEWLSPTQGAFEVKAKDPGLGITEAQVAVGSFHQSFPFSAEGKCNGAQCKQEYHSLLTYNPSMPDGEPTLEWKAENFADYQECLKHFPTCPSGKITRPLKVDSKPPTNLEVSGWPASREISAAPHAITVAATDEGPSEGHSSGVKSLAVSVDSGAETPIPGASCALGKCTASGKYTLDAEGLTEGVHRLVVTASDNAGNVSAKEFTFDVRHASPVAVGPGSVDPTTGQFKLSATDVSLAGVGGVSRVYQSRSLSAGAEGPLGPQWSVSLGGGEGLTVLPTGSVVLASPRGARTTFLRKTSGEYESPVGDTNLKLEAKEHETGKGITEYLFSDATAGTSTRFTQPAGTQSTTPAFINQFGNEATQLSHPVSDAIDPSGNIWVTDTANNRLEKFSPAGVLLGAYGSYGSGADQFISPWGIGVNQSNGNVYVSDQGNNRIEELSSSGTFIRTIGWGVRDGKAELETCTSGCQPGLTGTGSGEMYVPAGVAVDSSGNFWVGDYGNSRIQEFSETGGFIQKFGSEGSGEGQFRGAVSVAFSGGKVYATDLGNHRVQEFSTAGKPEGGFGEGTLSAPYGIATDPTTGNLMVDDSGNTRVQVFSPTGAPITKFGVSGSGAGQFTAPTGVAVSRAGAIYAVDWSTNRVENWGHPSWLPTLAEGALPSDTTSYAYEAVESEEKTVIEPVEALAPPPTGVSCGTKASELKRGCRALTFQYATSTTASGEGRGEWGEFKGRLSKVIFHGYGPASKAMEEVAVAQYAYDKQGRLRAAWDPRISPSLKTTYGYDVAGHVTAVTPPGQESWALVYGTSGSDPNQGRLLKVTRGSASTSLWNGEATKDTAAPSLTGTPVVGKQMTVAEGTWTNSPLVYGFQWEDCNSAGGECTSILGATNANYTPSGADVGHTLVAEVIAINGDGAVVAASSASAVVLSAASSWTQTVDSGHSLNAVSCVSGTTDCVVADSADETLYTTNASTSSSSSWNAWWGPSGSNGPNQAIDCPSTSLCLLANGKTSSGGNLYYATSFGGPWSLAYSPSYGVKSIACASSSFCINGETFSYFRYSTNPASTSWTSEAQGASTMMGASCLSSSFCALVDHGGHVHIATSTGQVESSSWKETDVDGTTELDGISCTSTTACVAVDGAGNVLSLTVESNGAATAVKHDIDGTTSLNAISCTTSAICVVVDSAGNVFTSKAGGEWTKLASLGDDLTSVSCASSTLCVTADTAGKVTTFNPSGEVTEGSAANPQPGSTIEYRVPASGASAPYALGASEAASWGQKDDPTEGMAIFPPDEPMGWPAKDYKRATVDYLDEVGRTVNIAKPSGGVATTEFNAVNEVIRTLSADDRATALKETGKTAEAAEQLDTKTEYNPSNSQIVKVTGPRHTVKLSSGAEVQARSVTRDFYDEGSPGGKTYNLLTKTTSGAEYEGKEADVRTTLTSYSGQGGLGWKLREPTSTTTDPGGLDLVSKTVYNEETGNVVETRSPGGNSETIYPPVFASAFGGAGSGNGQFNQPCGIAIDSSGNLWVVDSENGRIEKFSPSGTFIAAYGSKGSGNLQFQRPYGIAINPSTGNVYVGDYGNNRVEELNSSGAYVASFGTSGSGALSEPMGVTLDASGDVWVADRGHNRLVEFNAEGTYVRAVGSSGTGNGQFSAPIGLAISEGSLYAVDSGNDRVEQFSLTGEYLGQFGSKGSGAGQLKEPFGIAANPSSGNLYVADLDNNRVAEFSPAGRFLTQWETWGPSHQLSAPVGLAVDATGKLYVSDLWGAKVSSWTPPEAGAAHLSYASQIGSLGSGNGQFHTPIDATFDGEGNLWVSDLSNNRIEKFSSKGTFIAAYGSSGSGNGQFNGPGGIDINQSTGNVYVADTYNARIEELSSSGSFIRAFGTEGSGKLTEPGSLKIDSAGNLWVPDMSADKIFEYSSSGTFIAAYGKEGSGEVQFKKPIALAFSGENLYIADSANHRVQEITNKGAFVRNIGIEGSGSGELYDPEGIAADSAGNLYVVDAGSSHVEEFNASGGYLATFASSRGTGEGQLSGPVGDAIDAAGDLYVVDTENNRVEKWSHVNQKVHYTKTIYYSAAANSEYPQCGEHPEWANLACQVQPVSQPSDAPPSLPVTTSTYNLWDESEEKVEKLGSTTRTTLQHYDPAGRAYTSEETSTASNASLPTVTNEYSESTGALIVQKTTAEGKTKAITSKYNTLMELESYTDADGNTSKYTYDIDGRVEELNDGKGSQIYVHDPTTGFLTELRDSAIVIGSFKATYDVEGHMLSQSYPNGMTASYTINAVGQPVAVEYVKTTDCSSSCTWFADTIVPSIHGETLAQANTLSSESYTTDAVGRLTKTQETPVGKGCVTRIYGYDEESDRTTLTTREPGAEGKCSEEGGSTERHIYDEAGRLVDPGVTYDELGNATSLPASDAGGHELTASYYVDNQVHVQTQNGETLTFAYDPAGRTREAVSSGKTATTAISHYSGPGEALTWTSEGAEAWSRDIPGIDGTICAVQTNGGTPVLELHDLQGNAVGTAALSESETKLLSTYNSTEFGVPQPGTTPPKYAWLGASGLSSEPGFASGVSVQGGASYVPQIAKDLQTNPVVPPGAFPNGQGTGSAYTSEIPGWYIKLSEEQSAATLAEYTAAQEALRRQAEEEAEAESSQQEEGGGPSDPTNNLILFTPQEAIEFGDVLCSCSTLRGVSNAIETVAHKIGVPGVGEVLEELLTAGVAEALGRELYNCGEYVRSNPANRCALEYHSLEALGINTWLPASLTPFSIGACYYYKKSYKGEKRGLHCKDGQYYKPGSY